MGAIPLRKISVSSNAFCLLLVLNTNDVTSNNNPTERAHTSKRQRMIETAPRANRQIKSFTCGIRSIEIKRHEVQMKHGGRCTPIQEKEGARTFLMNR